MTAFKSIFAKVLLSFGIVAFLSVGVLGLSHFGMPMKMGMDGTMAMPDCLMPGMAPLCNMGLLEHIAVWQNAFLALPQRHDIFFPMLLLVLAGIAVLAGRLRQYDVPPQSTPRFFQRRVAWAYDLSPNLLQELFSSGVVHSKLF